MHQADAAVSAVERLVTDIQMPRLGEIDKIDRDKFEDVIEQMAADAIASGSHREQPAAGYR